MPLSDRAVANAKAKDRPYKLSDSQGLYLLIKPNASKHWYLKFHFGGREKKLAFGPYPVVSLSSARKLRDDARSLVMQGTDPSVIRAREKFSIKMGPTLEEVARRWYGNNRTWSKEHSNRVLRSLETYLFPLLGRRNISTVETIDLLQAVKAVESKGFFEVASRLQQRITAIMRYGVQHQIIKYNPALDLVGIVTPPPVKHHAALPLSALPDFFNRMKRDNGRLLTRLAVHLSLYTFLRSSEMRFARWEEIDFDNAIWTIPPRRTPIAGVRFSHRGSKMRTAQLVPLSNQAITLLRRIQELSGHLPILFPNDHDTTKVISENTINKTLIRLGYDTKVDVCNHGFRAMAYSALVESGRWALKAIDLQMSHQERNSVRAAYIHLAEHIELRIEIMQWWADYLDANQNNFISPYNFVYPEGSAANSSLRMRAVKPTNCDAASSSSSMNCNVETARSDADA